MKSRLQSVTEPVCPALIVAKVEIIRSTFMATETLPANEPSGALIRRVKETTQVGLAAASVGPARPRYGAEIWRPPCGCDFAHWKYSRSLTLRPGDVGRVVAPVTRASRSTT